MDLLPGLWTLFAAMLCAVVLLALLLLVQLLWTLLMSGSTSLLSRSASAVITERLGSGLAAVGPSDQERLWRLGATGRSEGPPDRSDLVHVARLVKSLAPKPAPRSSRRVLKVSSTLRYREQLLDEATERLRRRCSLVTETTAIRRARLYVVQEQARVLVAGFRRLAPALAWCWFWVGAARAGVLTYIGLVVAVLLWLVAQLVTQGSWTVEPTAYFGNAAAWGSVCVAMAVSAKTVLDVLQARPNDGRGPRRTRDALALILALLLVCLILGLVATGAFDRLYRWQTEWTSRWETRGLDGMPEGVRNVVLVTITAALVCLLVWCLVAAPLRMAWQNRGQLRFWVGDRVSTGILRSVGLIMWTSMAVLAGWFFAMGAAAVVGVAPPSTVPVWTLVVLALAPVVIIAVGLPAAGVARFVEHWRDRKALATIGLRRKRITPPWALVSGYVAGWLVVGVGSMLVFVAHVDGVVDDHTYPLLCAVVLVPAGATALAAVVHSRINSRRISDENVRLHGLAEHREGTGAGVS